MPTWSDFAARDNAANLRVFGEPITYIPNKGAGEPLSTLAILKPPAIEQSSSPGYFADIEIDPLVVTAPRKGDGVVWADGTAYVVGKVVPDQYGLTTVAIHRKLDPL